jgi:predicted HicB family RNase H-like nuclease
MKKTNNTFIIRNMPDGLRQWVKIVAAKKEMSMNQVIIHAIQLLKDQSENTKKD